MIAKYASQKLAASGKRNPKLRGSIGQGRKKEVEGCDGEAARESAPSDLGRWNYYIVYPILQNNEAQLVGVSNTFSEI